MRVFIYEFLTGGGCWSQDVTPAGSLLSEGSAMLCGLAEDFAALRDVEVLALRDVRLDGSHLPHATLFPISDAAAERAVFQRLASSADWTIVIAPETGGCLRERVQWAEQSGARLLSPSSEFIRVAENKQRTAECLRGAGVNSPRGGLWRVGDPLPLGLNYPVVLKPNDGAGSQAIAVIRDPRALGATMGTIEGAWRMEAFCAGMAASVSVLGGPGGLVVFPASRQRLSEDGHFRYLGGETPLDFTLCQRAERLARAVVAALPPARGYFGIDLVLGSDADGAQDVVIEVNPRLTTSYLGLRQLARENLAAAMLQVACGEPVAVSFDSRSVAWH